MFGAFELQMANQPDIVTCSNAMSWSGARVQVHVSDMGRCALMTTRGTGRRCKHVLIGIALVQTLCVLLPMKVTGAVPATADRVQSTAGKVGTYLPASRGFSCSACQRGARCACTP